MGNRKATRRKRSNERRKSHKLSKLQTRFHTAPLADTFLTSTQITPWHPGAFATLLCLASIILSVTIAEQNTLSFLPLDCW